MQLVVSDDGCGCRSDARSGLHLLWALIPLAAAFGDFTGDGELDIAVALENPDGSTGVGVYIRWPDQGEGLYYASLGALRSFEGEAVVDLVALEADGDGRPDLAVALTTASGGRLRVFLNRSVAPG